jgi:outer membrane immunogenic protein
LLSASQTRVGSTVGGGVEYKFTRNWSVKAEYLYIDFGSSSYFNGAGLTPLRVSFRDHVGLSA